MSHGGAQALGGSFLEVSQDPIHAADVHPWVTLSDDVRTRPTLFVFDQPSTLFGSEGIEGRHAR